jgi:two-component system cell cycle sensor histidine kinase/response regulator CckA
MLHSIDNAGRIQEVSDLWLSKLGYSWDEVIGRPSTDFLSEESARYAREVVLPAFYVTGTCDVEYEMRRKDGVLIPVRLHGAAVRNESGVFVRSIAVIEDLSERRALERKMFETQKLESLGLMAGNIAHDFNNLLASVVGNAQLSLRQVGHLPAVTSSLNDIMTAAARAADLCRQLLAYSGRGRFQIETIDLGELVTEMVKVLQVNVGKGIAIEVDVRPGTSIEVDATQIRQIVMNLVLNACEAMDGRHGAIKIKTSVEELDDSVIATSSRPDVVPGRYVCLEVTDQGSGMSPDVVTHIFDPFFTTKTTGRGLGLAAVHGIVRGHHGTLHVHSEQGRGTTFKIFLPAAGSKTITPRAASPVHLARGRVLVVDDDRLLRKTLESQLDEEGYQVLAAGSAAEALHLAHMSRIDVFLLDVTMPGISGAELAGQLKQQFPNARIVLMSGYNNVEMPTAIRTRFLQKPFTHEELLRALDHAG